MEISAFGCPTFYGISDVPSLMNFPSSWCDPSQSSTDEDVIRTIKYSLARSSCIKAITDGSSVSTRRRTRRDDASTKSKEIPYQRAHSRVLDEEASVQLRVLSEEESQAEKEGPTNVLSLPMMKGLQKYFPFSKRGESFWLQYSLVRDGASLDILLSKVKDSGHTLLAIETTEGEIFGAFTTDPWKVSHDYYGSGQSFLWKIDRESWRKDKSYPRHHHHHSSSSASVRTTSSSRSRRRHHPSVREHIQVFKFAFSNHCIQYCRPDRLILGGGTGRAGPVNPEWGFGLWLDHELYRGSSSPCATFQSPSLSTLHADGTPFEIRNLEVWALTPCLSLQDAERSQRHRRLMANSILPRSFSLRRKRNHVANR
eukprot:Nitzschia sp. Nitz4//scaffold335_size18684//12811//13917//NITZ4_008771-RA/size18684-processed-gene-0.6-mRNA-1//-1//CDS//3329548279//5207//frame0